MANSPTALCIQALALRLLGGIEAKNFLEIGVGAGDLLLALGKKGFTGKGSDFSSLAISQSKKKLEKNNIKGIELEKNDFLRMQGQFDLILAFEVIEHIKDDTVAFAKLYELLVPDGYFIMSVPAHQKLWGKSDIFAGHYRRYEKKELLKKIRAAGFDVKDIWSATYPTGNILKKVRDIFQNSKAQAKDSQGIELEERSRDSGVVKVINAPDWLYSILFNRVTVLPALILQLLFLHTDLGATYIVKAQKN